MVRNKHEEVVETKDVRFDMPIAIHGLVGVYKAHQEAKTKNSISVGEACTELITKGLESEGIELMELPA